jgi:hypothetical protein
MDRRTFLGTCITGVATAAVAEAQPPVDARAKALAALRSARQQEIAGNADRVRLAFHSDALRVEPDVLAPSIGRAAIGESLRATGRERKPVYFYYRQPQVRMFGSMALVVSNYEAGYDEAGKTVEDTGKVVNLVLTAPTPPVIALDVIVPNLYAGSYGALGAALAPPHFGLYPVRALGPATQPPTSAGGGENDILFRQVQEIDRAWVTGNANDLLRRADRGGVFLIGDYSPYYITGSDDIRQHFQDFYKTSRVNALRELNPTVKIWGTVAAVSFNFDLDYVLGGAQRRSPGRAVYVFNQRGAVGVPWAMAACAASHLVTRNIGDPYPLPVGD